MFKFGVMARIHKYKDSLRKTGKLELQLHLLLDCVRAGGQRQRLEEDRVDCMKVPCVISRFKPNFS